MKLAKPTPEDTFEKAGGYSIWKPSLGHKHLCELGLDFAEINGRVFDFWHVEMYDSVATKEIIKCRD